MTATNLIRRMSIVSFVVFFVVTEATAEPPSSAVERQERLEEMRRQAAEYTVTLDSPPRPLTLHKEPVLRFSNPVSGVPDGIVVMWKDSSRPAIFAQVFQTQDGLWIHECQSLAAAGLIMKKHEAILWQPDRSGEGFRPMPGAPDPADTPSKRLVQMKALAAEFSAADDFKIKASDQETTRHNLRLLPTPVHRYGDSSAGSGGAVFAFVHGTDPELFLVLEHFHEGETTGWRYALAPMTCWAVEASRDGRRVWRVEERLGKSKPADPYHVWIHRP